jgi:hypothetical protein
MIAASKGDFSTPVALSVQAAAIGAAATSSVAASAFGSSRTTPT